MLLDMYAAYNCVILQEFAEFHVHWQSTGCMLHANPDAIKATYVTITTSVRCILAFQLTQLETLSSQLVVATLHAAKRTSTS